jgi:Flp pilus assembly protein TadD
VQRLNRDGVAAIEKNDIQRAESLFYKAYLYDPADPFTLNNLGYVAELEGDLDRAQKFYGLAAEQGSNANIDRSNAKQLEGKPMRAALVDFQDRPMRVNRMNIDAMRLLSQDRGFEAVTLLKHALSLDPRNPFTKNNLGYASEFTGDLEAALAYYRAASMAGSNEPATITVDESWRGKSVSEMAAANAKRLEKRIQAMGPREERALTLTVSGVLAMNQNDRATARENFLRAFAMDPTSAFTLNNRGYVAEMDGDLETARYYYAKARRADDVNARVGLATDLSAHGKNLATVEADGNNKLDTAIETYSKQRHTQTGPIELTPRGDTLPTSDPQKQAPEPPGKQR